MSKTELFVRTQPGGVFSVVDNSVTTGNIWWVDSGSATGADAAGYGQNPDAPCLTLDYAIGLATANNGDIIYVMPGHSETFVATNGFDADVAGIRIIGLGWGASRPTFVFADTDAQVNVGAASVWLENLRFVAGIHAVVAGVQVEGFADVTFKNCEWYYGGTTTWDFILALELETPCHRAHITGCRFLGEPATAGCASAIKLTGGASHNVVIENCEFFGDYDPAAIAAPTAICQGLLVKDNFCYLTNSGEPFLETFSGTTGVVKGTHGFALANAFIVDAIMADTMAHCENYITNTIGLTAVVAGAAGSAVLDVDAA